MGDIATPPTVTNVLVSGTLESGEEIQQIYPVQHPSGEPNSIILARAFAMLKNTGGLLRDVGDSGMEFWLGSKFVGAIKFEIKQVSLAGADALDGLKRGQLVQ